MATYAPSLPSEDYAQFIVNTESNSATEELLEEYSEKYADTSYCRWSAREDSDQ